MLDKAQAGAPSRPDTAPVLATLSPFDAVTPRGAVTGAWLMGQLDIAAGLAGRKVSGGEALILSIKDLTFHAALSAGVEFVIHAELTRRGNSSFNLFLSAWSDPDHACTRIIGHTPPQTNNNFRNTQIQRSTDHFPCAKGRCK